MGETLRLTLLGDAGEQPAEIDLTPLNRDWEILSRSSATNARFINGQNQVTRTLEMELAPEVVGLAWRSGRFGRRGVVGVSPMLE